MIDDSARTSGADPRPAEGRAERDARASSEGETPSPLALVRGTGDRDVPLSLAVLGVRHQIGVSLWNALVPILGGEAIRPPAARCRDGGGTA